MFNLPRSVGQHAHSAYKNSNGVIMMHERVFYLKRKLPYNRNDSQRGFIHVVDGCRSKENAGLS